MLIKLHSSSRGFLWALVEIKKTVHETCLKHFITHCLNVVMQRGLENTKGLTGTLLDSTVLFVRL